jgi:hypothetical protein
MSGCVGVGVGVGVEVWVSVGVSVGVWVLVGVAVAAGIGVAGRVGAGVSAAVFAGRTVTVAVAVAVDPSVAVGRKEAIRLRPQPATRAPSTSRTDPTRARAYPVRITTLSKRQRTDPEAPSLEDLFVSKAAIRRLNLSGLCYRVKTGDRQRAFL